MLNLQDIAERIEQPNLTGSHDLETLSELADKYPYSQIFSILYLKGLGNARDVRFEEELLNHSYRIGDRTQLYQLIHDGEKEDLPEEEGSSLSNKEERIESEKPSVENKDTKSPTSSNDPLEQTILQHAYTANYKIEELSEEEIEQLAEKANEIRTSTKGNDTANEMSFVSWLNSNENYKEKTNYDKIAIDAIVNKGSDRKSSSKLFGEIEKPKKEFYSPIKKAKESLSEDRLPISETLAKIYVAQGNYPKAIYAYEQLSLKYPEKKIFFANQISELKTKINF